MKTRLAEKLRLASEERSVTRVTRLYVSSSCETEGGEVAGRDAAKSSRGELLECRVWWRDRK
jgi:hypothetical protein